ncbi:penicillin-binding protein 1A [Candidatus Endomicrobiellum trichonymphae]|uniref:peptidoglycan glycosyltransferase n=1 Tax=Endomicrobium trichonymphae TaxID=1408204 RepID=B1H0J0_ENDTX|nr:transglycosylase domain-containing protein [Candidatus Endomicrobium trichonymphae]BAG14022.1 bifunctional transglycosylase/transpeptidase [Candidatus Endomicrobium trichonymphae]
MKRKKPKKKSFLSFLTIALIVAVLVIAVSKITANFIDNLPSIKQLENYTPNLSTKIYDKDNNLIAELFTERRIFIPINKIPVNLQNAFIAIEDKDFFKHWGISIKGIMRAFSRILLKMKIAEGGSTITQQLAKTIFLTRDKTLIRKIKEAILTIQLEKNYSKDEILQLYINQIYFGCGAYGVQTAARIYFNKNAQDLNLAECATLAAIPKSPNYYNPFNNAKASLARRNLVLLRLRELGYITKEKEEEALAVALPTKETALKENMGHYLLEFLRIMLEPKYGTNVLFKGGLSIYTTIDMKAQVGAEKAIEEALANFDKNKLKVFEKSRQKPVKVQGALIAIDPKNGAIRAMVGGRNFRESQFNRAIQAKRQPGSAFKPFIYLAAIEKGLTPATLLNDEPMVFVYKGKGNSWNLVSRDITTLETIAETVSEKDLINTNKIWTPTNYDKKYRGPVILKTALASSINICAIETIMQITPLKVIQSAKNLGITTPLANSFSLALGSSDTTLQEMVSAFAVFASGGIKTTPYIITKITDRDGKILEQNIPQQKEVLSSQDCFIITNMLKAVVEKGSGWNAKNLGRPCAGKTGTTNDSSDAWFIGYTPQLAAGVWVGYDDHSISLGEKVTGGIIACPIWTQFMKEALDGELVLDFMQPENIEWALIDPLTGLLALSKTSGASLEAFVKGTVPTKY